MRNPLQQSVSFNLFESFIEKTKPASGYLTKNSSGDC